VLLDHDRRGVLHRRDDSDEMYAQRGLGDLEIGGGDPARLGHAAACAVHERVESAQALDGLPDGMCDVGLQRYIAAHEAGSLTQPVGEFLAFALTATGDHDSRSVCSEQFSRASPDSARSADYERPQAVDRGIHLSELEVSAIGCP
jgi:hypothetical protein